LDLSYFKGLSGIGIGGSFGGGAIRANKFTGNKAAAMDLIDSGSMAIINNTSEKDGAFLVCDDSGDFTFAQNQGRDFGAAGVLPAIYTSSGPPLNADAAIDIGDYSGWIDISENDLEGGSTPNFNGIAFSPAINYFGDTSEDGACNACQVTDNTIKGFPGNGIVAERAEISSTEVGTLYYSTISRNRLMHNGNDGILVEGPVALFEFNGANLFLYNQAEDNKVIDCEDDTRGEDSWFIGTLGTSDTWFNNSGSLSYPSGLCTPAPWD
jgi:hypothetical protein